MISNSEFSEEELRQRFRNLPLGGVMQLPASLLRPVEGDDGKYSKTEEEPIRAYLHVTRRGNLLGDEIRIEDGHHRYFRGRDRVRIEVAKKEGRRTVPDSEILFTIKKVGPPRRGH
jgi:hypothetical protein